MSNWTIGALGLEDIDKEAREKLGALKPTILPAGHILFRPGDAVSGFVMALSGRLGVYLTGANGRELLLYSVVPGQTCVQTTLGLLGEQYYTGEAIAETDISVVLVPKSMFMELMANSSGFRTFVFKAFADRLQTVMRVLEKVAFVTIEARLARCLLERADNRVVRATHQELAVMIGTSREVVSRRIEVLVRKGIVKAQRGMIELADAGALKKLAG
ncbi:Transcriptional regulator, Crp/Fnr family [hydrothermal vent metagenome]|uniref:Transcriptional regulator, Crp/Fnr family n=1 Tax=hydrothermal vent metagenome TaxID=652676 RepID=A0A3B0U389_9ZZZZ